MGRHTHTETGHTLTASPRLPPPIRSGLIKFRLACPLLRRNSFLSPQDITWHENSWDNPESRFLAFTLHDA